MGAGVGQALPQRALGPGSQNGVMGQNQAPAGMAQGPQGIPYGYLGSLLGGNPGSSTKKSGLGGKTGSPAKKSGLGGTTAPLQRATLGGVSMGTPSTAGNTPIAGPGIAGGFSPTGLAQPRKSGLLGNTPPSK
jgi:hypothetical protein